MSSTAMKKAPSHSTPEWQARVRREFHGWSAAAKFYQARYEPSLPRKLWILLLDNLYGFYLLCHGVPPYLMDIIRTRFFTSRDKRLPSSIKELANIETFSRVSGRKVSYVGFEGSREQHANSTDRSWLRVVYCDGEKEEESYLFAKCQAQDHLVTPMMSIFGIYKNELHAYSQLKMPVTIPKVHIAKWTRSRFVLVLEDLAKQGVVFPNIWETYVDKGLAKQVLSTLAKIHSRFWGPNVPAGVWNDETRPYYGIGMGLYTLWNVRKRNPGLISDDAYNVYCQALYNWTALRAYYSRRGKNHPKCMCHGDSHMGNYFIKVDDTIGTFDFQVLSEEHPMRDVTYFLMSSYPPDNLVNDEKELIEYYLEQLEECGLAKSEIPSFENCWLNYRMHSWYALYAFVFSGGFSNLMDTLQTHVGVGRILKAMERVDAAGALYDLLDGKL